MPQLTLKELREQLFANAALLFNAHHGSKTHSVGSFDAVIASVDEDEGKDFVCAALVFHPSTAFRHARLASNGFTPVDAPLRLPTFKLLLKGPARPEPYDALHALLMLTAHKIAERLETGESAGGSFSSTLSSDSLSGVIFKMDTSPIIQQSSKFGTDASAGKAQCRIISEPLAIEVNERVTTNLPIPVRERSRTIVPASPIRQNGHVAEGRKLSRSSLRSLRRASANGKATSDEGSATETEHIKDEGEDEQTYAGL